MEIALDILRQYKIAKADNIPRQITHIKIFHPTFTNTVATFCFLNYKYFVLFDDIIDDDFNEAIAQIRKVESSAKLNLLHNPYPDSDSLYAISFKGKSCYLFSVISEKKRLDIELSTRYPEISRSLWQKYIKQGLISVNNIVVKSANYKVSDFDNIAVNLPKTNDFTDNSLPIIFIDDDIIVIDKPIGVLSHAKGENNDEFTVADFIKRYSSYNAATNRPGIVHRLDRDTSGVIIGARNDEAAKMLQKQFADRKTKKTYLAIVVGRPKLDIAKIDLPIARNPSKPSTFRVDPSGKSAITKYEIVATSDKYSLVKLQPQTGRTHQLRVHMKYLNTPILGDKVYGEPANRLFLHAYSLEITTPNGERKIFTSPVPDEFKKYFSDISL